MGKRQTSRALDTDRPGLDSFGAAVRKELATGQRVVRVFDVGGTGVKTGLLSAAALRDFLVEEPVLLPCQESELPELEWLEPPRQLGMAPGDSGFMEWLPEALPRLRQELSDQSVVFGVSSAGDVEHETGLLHDWWSGGGHPRSWYDGRPSPTIAAIMGLPPQRTFVLHDGSAHLLGCSRCSTPPPRLACFALGTGVGFGISDESGAAVDPSVPQSARSHLLNGAPLSGAQYEGVWQTWLRAADGEGSSRADAVLAREFAGMKRPWRTPWVSLVLGRRGMELAEAVHGCPEPCDDADDAQEHERRWPAVHAYGQQWLHFLHTTFLRQFAVGSRRHRVEQICFSGGIAEANWPMFSRALADESTGTMLELPAAVEPGSGGRHATKRKAPATAVARVALLAPAPRGAALIGAGIYALAGAGRSAAGVWAV